MRTALCFLVMALGVGCASTTTIHTKPAEARVYINGERCNESPCIHHSRYGFPDRMRVQIHAAGYENAEFFVDTEAPMPSYLLLGFGSYVLHTFDEEYHFALHQESSPKTPVAPSEVSEPVQLNPTEPHPVDSPTLPPVSLVANAIEQCLLLGGFGQSNSWVAQEASVQCQRARDWTQALLADSTQSLGPTLSARIIELSAQSPELAAAERLNSLCSAALVAFARERGAGRADFESFRHRCPKQHELLMQD